MRINLNGQWKESEDSLSLKSLVDQLSDNPEHIIAELNGTIIKRKQWDDKKLQEGDSLELLSFVGGG